MPKLPGFNAVSKEELRELWRKYPDEDIRRLILEVERGRQKMAEAEGYFATVQKAYRENVGGHLVAMHLMKVLLSEERSRRGD